MTSNCKSQKMRPHREKKKMATNGKKKPERFAAPKDLPLSKKSVYIDMKRGKAAELMGEHLARLGAKIEAFLSAEVNYVISSFGPSSVGDDNQTCSTENPQSPANSVASPFSFVPSPSGPCGSDSKKSVVSRGKALADLARSKKVNQTSNVVSNAEKMGVKVISVEVANRWLEKELRKLEADMKRKAEDVKEKSKACSPKKERKTKSKVLKGCYIKFEAISRHYKPVKSEMEKWPRVNAFAPPGLFPFVESKIKTKPSFVSLKNNNRKQVMNNTAVLNVEKLPQNTQGIKRCDPRVHAPKEVLATPVTTAGDIKRNHLFKRNINLNKQQGYCDCCESKFKDFDQHVGGDEHQAFARDKSKYESLDNLISQVPSTAKFLQEVLIAHCMHKQKEPNEDTSVTDADTATNYAPSEAKLDRFKVTGSAGASTGAPLILNTPQLDCLEESPSKDQLTLLATDTDVASFQETPQQPLSISVGTVGQNDEPKDEAKLDERLQAVVVRRPVPSGIFTSPRRPRQPTPNKTPKVMERSMVFRDSPIASLQPSPCSGESPANGSLLFNTSQVTASTSFNLSSHRPTSFTKSSAKSSLLKNLDFEDPGVSRGTPQETVCDSNSQCLLNEVDHNTNVQTPTTRARSGSKKKDVVRKLTMDDESTKFSICDSRELDSHPQSANFSAEKTCEHSLNWKSLKDVNTEVNDPMHGSEQTNEKETVAKEPLHQVPDMSKLVFSLKNVFKKIVSPGRQSHTTSAAEKESLGNKEKGIDQKDHNSQTERVDGFCGISKVLELHDQTKSNSVKSPKKQDTIGEGKNRKMEKGRYRGRSGSFNKVSNQGAIEHQKNDIEKANKMEVVPVVATEKTNAPDDALDAVLTTTTYSCKDGQNEIISNLDRMSEKAKSTPDFKEALVKINQDDNLSAPHRKIASRENKDSLHVGGRTRSRSAFDAVESLLEEVKQNKSNPLSTPSSLFDEADKGTICTVSCADKNMCSNKNSEVFKFEHGIQQTETSKQQDNEKNEENKAHPEKFSSSHKTDGQACLAVGELSKTESTTSESNKNHQSKDNSRKKSNKKSNKLCEEITKNSGFESVITDAGLLSVPNIAERVKEHERTSLHDKFADDADVEDGCTAEMDNQKDRKVVKASHGSRSGKIKKQISAESQSTCLSKDKSKRSSLQRGDEGCDIVVPNIADRVKRRSCTLFNHVGQYANSGEGSDSESLPVGVSPRRRIKMYTKSMSSFRKDPGNEISRSNKSLSMNNKESRSCLLKTTETISHEQHDKDILPFVEPKYPIEHVSEVKTNENIALSGDQSAMKGDICLNHSKPSDPCMSLSREEHSVEKLDTAAHDQSNQDTDMGTSSAVVIRRRKTSRILSHSHKPRPDVDWAQPHTYPNFTNDSKCTENEKEQPFLSLGAKDTGSDKNCVIPENVKTLSTSIPVSGTDDQPVMPRVNRKTQKKHRKSLLKHSLGGKKSHCSGSPRLKLTLTRSHDGYSSTLEEYYEKPTNSLEEESRIQNYGQATTPQREQCNSDSDSVCLLLSSPACEKKRERQPELFIPGVAAGKLSAMQPEIGHTSIFGQTHALEEAKRSDSPCFSSLAQMTEYTNWSQIVPAFAEVTKSRASSPVFSKSLKQAVEVQKIQSPVQANLKEAGLEANYVLQTKTGKSSKKKGKKRTRVFSPSGAVSPTAKKKIKLAKSWRLASLRSITNFVDSEKDSAASFNGFQENAGDNVPSALSFANASEVELDSYDGKKWVIDTDKPEALLQSDSEGTAEKLQGDFTEDSEANPVENDYMYTAFVPMFSSPAKGTNSSWDDACESYISTSLDKSSINSKVEKQRKSSGSKCRKSVVSQQIGSSVVGNLCSNDKVKESKKFLSPKKKAQFEYDEENAVSPLRKARNVNDLTPAKGVSENSHAPNSIIQIDRVISFNLMSPQKMKSSPLKANK